MTGLLNALRSYRPREGRDSLEDFITEAFCWLLQTYDGLAQHLVQHIDSRCQDRYLASDLNLHWETQVSFGGGRLDMAAFTSDDALFIAFEHKVWSKFSGQLANYAKHLEKERPDADRWLVTITPRGCEHLSAPGRDHVDVALSWGEIYKLLQHWNEANDPGPNSMVQDFLLLLSQEGLGPSAPISNDGIMAYYPAQGLKAQTSALLQRTRGQLRLEAGDGDFKISLQDKARGAVPGECWGRIGMFLHESWAPSVFVGFLFDPWDHRVDVLRPEVSPDFSIILTFAESLHEGYRQDPDYVAVVEWLQRHADQLGVPWNLLDHAGESERPNLWHPVHLRMPMLDLFRGLETSEEQDRKFIETVEKVVQPLLDLDEFRSLRQRGLEAESHES